MATTRIARKAATHAALDRVIQTLDLTYGDTLDSLHGLEAANAISLHASGSVPTFMVEAMGEAEDDDLRELMHAVCTGDPEASDMLADIIGSYANAWLAQRLLETDTTGMEPDQTDDSVSRARAVNGEMVRYG